MYHDENAFNVRTGFLFMEDPANYPYGPTYAPLMNSASAIDAASSIPWTFQQAQNWITPPASSTVTQSPQLNLRYREIRPQPPHKSATPSPPREANKEEQHNQLRELGRGKHSKRQRQLDHEPVQRTTKHARRTVSEVTENTNQPVRDDEMSTAKPPPALRHDSATQVPRPRSPGYASNNPENTSQALVKALQESLKVQVLQSLRVLREIARNFRAFNLELETIDSWIAEINGVDATLIPVVSSITIEVLVPFESLNFILTECMTASGSMRGFIIRDQALKLLKYIQTNAEKFNLFQNPRVYLDIGRWIERLSPGKDDEQGE